MKNRTPWSSKLRAFIFGYQTQVFFCVKGFSWFEINRWPKNLRLHANAFHFIHVHQKHTPNHLIAWIHHHAWQKEKKGSEELRGLGPQEWSRVSLPVRKDEYLAKKSQGVIYPKGYEAKTPSAKKKSRVTTRKLTFLQYYFCNLCQRTPSKQKSFDDTTKEQKQIKAYIYERRLCSLF